jgi:hypothetical protein
MKLASMVIPAGLLAAGLIASHFYFNIESAKAVVTKLSNEVATFVQLDIFNADGELNVFTLLLICLGFICFITLRGK